MRDMAQRAKAAVMAIAVTAPDKPPTLFERLWGKSESRGSLLSYASADVSSTSSLGPSQNIGAAGTVPMLRSPDRGLRHLRAHGLSA